MTWVSFPSGTSHQGRLRHLHYVSTPCNDAADDRELFDLIDELAASITDDEIEARLQEILRTARGPADTDGAGAPKDPHAGP